METKRPRARRWLFTLLGWWIFVGALFALILVDYAWRMGDGDVHSGGFPETLFFALHSAIGVVAFLLIVKGSRELRRWWLRLLVAVLQLGVGVFIYLFGMLAYVVGTGIDAL